MLRTGGPSAVTVDAVTRGANVARATLYRHFPSGNDLLAAAFHSLIPPAPMPPETGTLRERLLALLQAQADLISETPALLSATYWLALGPDMEHLPGKTGDADSPEVRTLRERVAQQYGAPFDAIFDSPDARRELGEVDRAQAIMLLIGPLVAGRISTLADFDYRECARAAVDGFLAVHRISEITSASSESAGV
ncbi:TetR family transcriptional regulator [Mycolicibacterium aichiense]|uniref:TetR family transcriptional regulator n=1 Tax=Mycolicibacterium aichiense TaxID=1799 RepID=A0AAD1HQC8_9MYCO|nr:TetR family transcriptional regulator [Mycolicibacterium aichiense]